MHPNIMYTYRSVSGVVQRESAYTYLNDEYTNIYELITLFEKLFNPQKKRTYYSSLYNIDFIELYEVRALH